MAASVSLVPSFASADPVPPVLLAHVDGVDFAYHTDRGLLFELTPVAASIVRTGSALGVGDAEVAFPDVFLELAACGLVGPLGEAAAPASVSVGHHVRLVADGLLRSVHGLEFGRKGEGGFGWTIE